MTRLDSGQLALKQIGNYKLIVLHDTIGRNRIEKYKKNCNTNNVIFV